MTTETITVHKFELAGLGKAPYKFCGVTEHKFQACQGAPIQAGTSCDYCHNSIMYAANLESADGKRFKVGCDCVQSAGDSGMRKRVSDWQRKHDKALRDAAKARKATKVRAEYAELIKELDAMHALRDGFASSFAASVSRQVASGKAPSARQLEVIARLRAEVAA